MSCKQPEKRKRIGCYAQVTYQRFKSGVVRATRFSSRQGEKHPYGWGLLFIAILGGALITGGVFLTTVLNPAQVQTSILWTRSDPALGIANDVISDIATANISGTIYVTIDFKPASFVDSDGIAYTFSQLALYVYPKVGSTYSTTAISGFDPLASTTVTEIANGWYGVKLAIDTTRIPNGDYEFSLVLTFQSYDPGTYANGLPRGKAIPISTFLASFGGNPPPSESSDYILLLLLILAAAAAATVLLIFGRRGKQ